MKRFIKLAAIAIPVAGFQLPVMQERSLSLSPISEALAQSTHDQLARITGAVGGPVVGLRAAVETGKSTLEARVVEADVTVAEARTSPEVDAPAAPRSASPTLTVTATLGRPIHAVYILTQASLASQGAAMVTASTMSIKAATPVVPPGPVAVAAVTQTASGGATTKAGSSPTLQSPAIQTTEPGSGAAGVTPEAEAPSSASVASAAAVASTDTADIFHQKKTVVLEGDSVMGEIAFSFLRFTAHHTSWKAVNAYKVSSGLCNTEYYDWPQVAGDLAKQYHPDIVLLTMGPNDAQDIYLPGKRLKIGTDAWHAEYVERFKTLVHAASSTGAKVYWFVVPVMRDSTLESKMVFIRAAQRDALSQMPQVGVIDRSADFVDADGHFIEKGKINGKLRTLRTGDGVHLMPVAADLLVDAFARMLAPSTVETAPAPSSGTSAGAASAASAPALATSPGQN